MATETHIHVPVLLLTEGVDLESQVPVGYVCRTCGAQLCGFVPKFIPRYLASGLTQEAA